MPILKTYSTFLGDTQSVIGREAFLMGGVGSGRHKQSETKKEGGNVKTGSQDSSEQVFRDQEADVPKKDEPDDDFETSDPSSVMKADDDLIRSKDASKKGEPKKNKPKDGYEK